MPKVVEPPVLISRILIFILATSIVVLATLIFTLFKMTPLERPEVFFLQTDTRPAYTEIVPLSPESNKTEIEKYKKGFIREYIIARNTIYENLQLTKDNWKNIVKPWSSEKVYKFFETTKLYDKIFNSDVKLDKVCNVNFFPSTRVNETNVAETIQNTGTRNEYFANIQLYCKNSSGQHERKQYKIRIRLKEAYNKTKCDFKCIKDLEKNPLGIMVSKYEMLNYNDAGTLEEDPLNLELTDTK